MSTRSIITDAIARIGDTNSIGVPELAFELTCQPGVNAGQLNRAPADRQLQIISALTQLPTEQSLGAILRSLERADAASTVPSPRPLNKDLRNAAEKWLARQAGTKKEQWRQILSAFGTNNLSPSRREFLERAMGRD